MSEAAETDQIERDLAKTRARMDDRLDALQDRLSPAQLANDAFAYFKGGDGGDFTQELLAKAKANPLPALLTGVGLAWLVASSARPVLARGEREPDLPTRLHAAETGVTRRDDEHPDDHAVRVDEARGAILGIARQSADTAASYGQRVWDAMASAAQTVRRTSHDLSTGASNTARHLGDHATRGGFAVQERMENMARSTRETLASTTRNPIALGAVAALVGLVAGALIPTTDEEERALGATAEKLRATGRDLAQDVVDRGARVASDAVAAVKDSAQTHGLSSDKPVGEMLADLQSGALVGAIKDVATESVGAGKESVQTHFAGSDGREADTPPQRS